MKELSLSILDIVQNSLRAKASEISIEINESIINDLYRIIIKDNGIGIPEYLLRNITDPFVATTTRRKMGLGLSLLKYHAELTGGGMEIKSETGKGSEVKTTFSFSHIDRQPLGDIVSIIVILLASTQGINYIYYHKTDFGEYRFSSKETKEFLEADTRNERNLLEDTGWIIGENLKGIEASGFELRERNVVV